MSKKRSKRSSSKRNRQQQSKNRRISPVKLERWGKRLGVFLGILGIAVGVILAVNALTPDRPGFTVAVQGSTHSSNCDPESYNTLPPTSGCHQRSQASYGVSDSRVPLDLQIHNLEHGAVIIQYRNQGLNAVDASVVDAIEGMVEQLRRQDTRYCRLISAPYPGQFNAPNMGEQELSEKAIALTAWGQMDLLESFNRERIMAFIDAHINNGPENVNDC